MKFIIRDDDLNYFSKPADIKRWYSDIFLKNIPVGFSTIPFIKPSGDLYPDNFSQSSGEYPIGENFELVSYIKENQLIEILQHGTTHETKNGVFEYADDIALEEAVRGADELRRTFGGQFTEIFVPPHDWIGKKGIFAIEKANLNVIRGRGTGLRNLIFRWEYIVVFVKMLFYKLSFIAKNKKVPAYPHVLDFGRHKEVCSYRLEDTDVFEGLRYTHEKNGIFVVVTHLHFFTEEKKNRLLELIEKARDYNAEFVLPSDIF